MPRKRLVCIVEGKGDVRSVPALVQRLLNDLPDPPWQHVILDPNPIRAGSIQNLTGNEARQQQWLNRIQLAVRTRKDVGAVLAVLDGDAKTVEGQPFCPGVVACTLAERAKAAQAGTKFSLGCVFICKEYEALFLAGIESLSGKAIEDRRGVKPGAVTPPFAIEEHRDAKKWLSEQMFRKYSPPLDQLPLTHLLDLALVRSRNLRSFGCLERTLGALIEAVRSGEHVALPNRMLGRSG